MKVVVFASSLVLLLSSQASAQPVRGRVSVLVGASSDMRLTPEILTLPETCATLGFNGCTFSTNPTAAQEQCNACVEYVIESQPTCATSWAVGCRTLYQNCWRGITGNSTGCGQVLGVTTSLATRGDGTDSTPGCDVDGDGSANDSRLYKVKEGLANVIAAFGEVEYSLYRFSQIDGGQTCTGDAECPDTPSGHSELTCENVSGTQRCVLDGTTYTSQSGQCSVYSWTGADAAFSCDACSTQAERLLCRAYGAEYARTGATSLLAGTVDCALPTTDHPYLLGHGAVVVSSACQPSGGDQLVDFPASGAESNTAEILEWIDNEQPDPASDVEIHAHGLSVIAAALRDMRASLLTEIDNDPAGSCRPNAAVLIASASEQCETGGDAVAAAATIADLGVPLYVIGAATDCPVGVSCTLKADLDMIAAAGGTTSAILVPGVPELEYALSSISSTVEMSEVCNGIDDDCDTSIDEDFPTKGSACSAGIGACHADGTLVCTGDQTGVECSAVAGTPSAEICDGIDNDCDGTADDSCTPPTATCPASPAPGCVASGSAAKVSLKISTKAGDATGAKNKLQWKQGAGPAIDGSMIGDPTSDASFALCVYDDGDLVVDAQVGPSDTLWTRTSTGYQYKSKDASGDGITKLQIGGGVAGKSKLASNGKGSNLDLPAPVAADRMLTAAAAVTVQLHGSFGGCYESVLVPGEISSNTATSFKAKR